MKNIDEELNLLPYRERLYRAACYLRDRGMIIPVDMLARLEAEGFDIRKFQ